ncbi:MAG: hypothetical protein ACRDOH_12990 [Streptosporangiaceae bacterium]
MCHDAQDPAPILVTGRLATATELAGAAQVINRHLASGGFTITADGIMPLGKTAQAHALVESRQSARAIIQIGRRP